MKEFRIVTVSKDLIPALRSKIDHKTKPIGSLGDLEELALRIGLIQNTSNPMLRKPTIIVFAADHGIAREGVSAYPQEVTYQMVSNILKGGAAINVFCRQHGIAIQVVDSGINHEFRECKNLIDAKIGMGTENFLYKPAMNFQQAEDAIAKGAAIVEKIHRDGCNIIGFGEMGIGNTSSASVLMSVLCDIPIAECVGRGTGLDAMQVQRKMNILSKAIENHQRPPTPLDALATFGGFEIAQMCGAMLQAAELQMIVLVDGFIATTAFLVAYKINRCVLDYAIFSHQSEESGHKILLQYFNAQPVLNLNMRLGEGTGCALAYPLLQSAVTFLNEMASFESAGVSQKLD
jgi:nicotinate-nucleotide--dimethylbenzimidazole phosphoribosyltransferase